MKRQTALLLAMAALLAHALAIHVDPGGGLAPPRDEAHVAYRLARNWVRTGWPVWNPGESVGLEAYASPVWVAVSAVAERLYLPVTRFTQVFGILCALLTVGASARFATDRIAGIVPPLLLVSSSCLASAATSGTEWPLMALLVTVAYVAFEHRRRPSFTLALVLMVGTRPEGGPMVVLFAVLALLERLLPRSDQGSVTPWWTFAPATLALALVAFGLRDAQGDSAWLGWTRWWLHPSAGSVRTGVVSVVDSALFWTTPLLVVFPVGALLLGRLGGAGARGILVAATWTALVVLEGGGDQAFHIALAPALAPLFVAVQQGVLVALDTGRLALERLAWVMLLGATTLSLLGSRFTEALGRVSPGELLVARLSGQEGDAFVERERYGRAALQAEIERTARMRELGLFLRDHAPRELDLLTPWPGSVGYLSGRPVRDLFGRIPDPEGRRTSAPWDVAPRADLVTRLEARPALVLPGTIDPHGDPAEELGLVLDLELLARDVAPSLERVARLRELLAEYELTTLPLSEGMATPRRFRLLRRRDLGMTPELALERPEGEGGDDPAARAVEIEVRLGESARPPRTALPQMAELEVRVGDANGQVWYVDPSGAYVRDLQVLARAELVLRPVGDRPTRLMRWEPRPTPDGAEPVWIEARLMNPGMRARHALTQVGEVRRLGLR